MHAAAVRIEFRLPECHSLKAKRRVLRPMVDHLRRRMELSVAEVDHQDAWQRTALGIAVVAPQASRLDTIVDSLRRWAIEQREAVFIDLEVGYVEMP
jgi:uncharacterized protein YlxP (DUF503 family)